MNAPLKRKEKKLIKRRPKGIFMAFHTLHKNATPINELQQIMKHIINDV
jgi:hypothetical protein